MKRILTTFVLFLVILLSAGTVLLLGNSILDAIRQPSGLKAENASGGGLLLMSEEETSKALETTTQEPRSFEEGASSLKIASEASEAVSAQEEPEEEGRAEAEQEGETGYAYEQLDGEERTLYLELLRAIIGFDENAQLSVWNLETIDRVFACVLADHPELFYVDGYTCTEHKLGEEVRGVTFSAGYTMTKEAAASKQEQIEKAVSRPLSLLTEDMEEYEKIRILYEDLLTHTEYQLDAPENQNILSVFLYGRSVCQGYAKAFQYLCLRADIPAVLAAGTASGQPHAWTVVSCGGEWYHVDPTWGDASYRLAEEATAAEASTDQPDWGLSYDYFLVDDDWILTTHTIDNPFPLPACSSLDNNYYVRSNAYFTSFDQEQAEDLFQEAYAQGQTQLTLKCADAEVYEAFVQHLITDQEIFSYLQNGASTAAYSLSADQYTLTFWL